MVIYIPHIDSQCNSPTTVRNTPNTSNNQANAIITQSPNNTGTIGCLQSQILGLQTQALQQSTLNSIKIFDGNKQKANLHHGCRVWKMQLSYATWTHSALHYLNFRDLHFNQHIS